jgi:hypothetical protein
MGIKIHKRNKTEEKKARLRIFNPCKIKRRKTKTISTANFTIILGVFESKMVINYAHKKIILKLLSELRLKRPKCKSFF